MNLDETLSLARQLAKSYRDASANGQTELAAELAVALADINARLIKDGFAPVNVCDCDGAEEELPHDGR